MQGVRKDSRRLRIKGSSILTEIPRDDISDTCPICGRYMPLGANGYCNDEEYCAAPARSRIREIVRDGGGKDIPGLYYKFGSQEIFLFAKLEKWKEPVAPGKDPDLCDTGDCQHFALPNDWLCRGHRIEANRQEMLDRQAKRKNRAKPRSDKKRQSGNDLTHRMDLSKFKR